MGTSACRTSAWLPTILIYGGVIADRQTGSSLERVGILYVDLDGFKPINDTYGHEADDEPGRTGGEPIDTKPLDSQAGRGARTEGDAMQDRAGRDGERCSECSEPTAAVDRFCGRCGAHLPPPKAGAVEGPTSAPGRVPVSAEASPDQPGTTPLSPSPTAPHLLPRRTMLAGFGGLAAGGVMGAMIHRWIRSGPPRDEAGLPTAEVEVGDARDLTDQLANGGVAGVPGDPDGRIAIIRWDPSYSSASGSAMERYGPEGEGHPILAADAGLIALSPISTHLGCRAPFCATSQWFEDPCHGARWNSWGEWTGGPAPRGLDRFVSWVREDGVYVVDLTRHIIGPERTLGVLDQLPQGPHCVDG